MRTAVKGRRGRNRCFTWSYGRKRLQRKKWASSEGDEGVRKVRIRTKLFDHSELKARQTGGLRAAD